MRKKYELIDYFKGYSIFTIIIYHCLTFLYLPEPYSNYILFGGTGVHLFVLVSGFGLYLSYLRNPISFGSFIRKRFSKIYVPYILFVLIAAFISLFIPIYKNSLYALGGHIFLYKMFDEKISLSYGYQLWFLSMIFQFYLFFYVLTYIRKRMERNSFLLLSFSISIGWSILIVMIGKESERVWNSFFLQYLFEFAIGMEIAKMIKEEVDFNKYRLKPVYYLMIGLINCAFYAALALKGGEIGKVFNDIPALIGYTSISLWVFSFKIKTVNRFFIFTGKISYSLYLFHVLVLSIFFLYLKNWNGPVIILISLMLTYLISYYYDKIIAQLLNISRPKPESKTPVRYLQAK